MTGYNLDDRQYRSGGPEWTHVDVPLEGDILNKLEDHRQVLAWLVPLCDDLPEEPTCIRFTNRKELIEIYCRNGRIDRTDGPAVIVHLSEYSLFLYYQNGLLHRMGGPAVCEFSNKSDFRAPLPKGVKDKPTRKWSRVEFSYYENGIFVNFPRATIHNGVLYWDIDNTITLTRTYKTYFNSIIEIGKYSVRSMELTGVMEEFENGQSVNCSWEDSYYRWDWHSSTHSLTMQADKNVNEWLKKNLVGQLDPYHPNLFTDQLTEFAFLEEFQ